MSIGMIPLPLYIINCFSVRDLQLIQLFGLGLSLASGSGHWVLVLPQRACSGCAANVALGPVCLGAGLGTYQPVFLVTRNS